jgi:hypothetical protein
MINAPFSIRVMKNGKSPKEDTLPWEDTSLLEGVQKQRETRKK